jgi:sec-independent protein translocase protein TatA
MFGFGHWELLIVLLIAMIIFGAGRLPQAGSGLGKSIWNFKKGITEDGKVEIEKTPKIETGK